MTDLRQDLHDLAAQARPYGDAHVAIRTDRRRRVARQTTVAATAALAVAAAATLWTQLAGPVADPQPPGASASPTRNAPVAFLDDAPPLPQGQPVARAELIIVRETDKLVANLLLSDGTQYRIDGPSPGLSPDKRWLVFRSGGQTVVRDLQTGLSTELDVEINDWSANSEWALAVTDGGHVVLRTGEWEHGGTIASQGRAVAIFDDGTVLAFRSEGAGDPTGSTLSLDVLGPTGHERQLDIDLSSVLRPGEQLSPPRVEVSGPANGFGVIPVGFTQEGTTGLLGALVIFSTDDGTILRRIDIPAQRRADRRLERAFADRITVLHWAEGIREIETLNPQTGAVVGVLTVTGDGVKIATGVASI